jgi:hypothetical protein
MQAEARTLAVTGSLHVTKAIDPSSSGIFLLTSGSILDVAKVLGGNERMAFIGSSKLVIDNPAAT